MSTWKRDTLWCKPRWLRLGNQLRTGTTEYVFVLNFWIGLNWMVCTFCFSRGFFVLFPEAVNYAIAEQKKNRSLTFLVLKPAQCSGFIFFLCCVPGPAWGNETHVFFDRALLFTVILIGAINFQEIYVIYLVYFFAILCISYFSFFFQTVEWSL